MQEKLNTSANNSSLENATRQPKSVRDLRSMFEQNIKKYDVKKEVAAAAIAKPPLPKMTTPQNLKTNVFEAQILKQRQLNLQS